jgi:hypothetical protein
MFDIVYYYSNVNCFVLYTILVVAVVSLLFKKTIFGCRKANDPFAKVAEDKGEERCKIKTGTTK